MTKYEELAGKLDRWNHLGTFGSPEKVIAQWTDDAEKASAAIRELLSLVREMDGALAFYAKNAGSYECDIDCGDAARTAHQKVKEALGGTE